MSFQEFVIDTLKNKPILIVKLIINMLFSVSAYYLLGGTISIPEKLPSNSVVLFLVSFFSSGQIAIPVLMYVLCFIAFYFLIPQLLHRIINPVIVYFLRGKILRFSKKITVINNENLKNLSPKTRRIFLIIIRFFRKHSPKKIVKKNKSEIYSKYFDVLMIIVQLYISYLCFLSGKYVFNSWLNFTLQLFFISTIIYGFINSIWLSAVFRYPNLINNINSFNEPNRN